MVPGALILCVTVRCNSCLGQMCNEVNGWNYRAWRAWMQRCPLRLGVFEADAVWSAVFRADGLMFDAVRAGCYNGVRQCV